MKNYFKKDLELNPNTKKKCDSDADSAKNAGSPI